MSAREPPLESLGGVESLTSGPIEARDRPRDAPPKRVPTKWAGRFEVPSSLKNIEEGAYHLHNLKNITKTRQGPSQARPGVNAPYGARFHHVPLSQEQSWRSETKSTFKVYETDRPSAVVRSKAREPLWGTNDPQNTRAEGMRSHKPILSLSERMQKATKEPKLKSNMRKHAGLLSQINSEKELPQQKNAGKNGIHSL
jgi:hypothetical protein